MSSIFLATLGGAPERTICANAASREARRTRVPPLCSRLECGVDGTRNGTGSTCETRRELRLGRRLRRASIVRQCQTDLRIRSLRPAVNGRELFFIGVLGIVRCGFLILRGSVRLRLYCLRPISRAQSIVDLAQAPRLNRFGRARLLTTPYMQLHHSDIRPGPTARTGCAVVAHPASRPPVCRPDSCSPRHGGSSTSFVS